MISSNYLFLFPSRYSSILLYPYSISILFDCRGKMRRVYHETETEIVFPLFEQK